MWIIKKLSKSLCPWKCFVVYVYDPVFCKAQIYPCCGNVLVSEYVLKGLYVRSVLNHVGSKGIPEYLRAELVGKVNIWLAQWGSSEPYCKCMLWQYAVGRSGTIRGIPGEIDLDYCYGGISDSTGSSTGSSSSTGGTKTAPDIWYQVFAKGRWLPYVKNLSDYAGLENKPVYGLRCKVSKGHIRYRVHLIGGGWLPWVTDTEDFAGASRLNRQIDCVQMELIGVDGYTVQYRVSTVKSNGYLPYVEGWNDRNDDGYAGIYGVAVDKVQAKIVKR